MDPKPVRLIETETRHGPLPPLGLPVQVQCDGFKYMAFLDKHGQWIDLFTQEPLSRVFGAIRT